MLTATVAAVLGDHAFLVRNGDLPPDGLLVFSARRTRLHPPDAVTVDGVVRRFTFDDFAVRFALREPAFYRSFEGGKVVVAVAVSVRSA